MASGDLHSAITVRQCVHDYMRLHGLTTVFGNPGSSELPFLADWPKGFRYILALQESIAVAAADGYTQATSRAAIVNLHAAAGLGNAMGQLTNARRNCAPLLVLVGRQPRGLHTGEAFVDLYDPEMAAGTAKAVFEPSLPRHVPELLQQAHHLAMSHPRGPVVLVVPADDWAAAAAPVQPKPIRGGPTYDHWVLGEMAAALCEAHRPAIVAGADVDRDGAVGALVSVAEATGARVWQAPMSSRCAYPESHPLFAGHLPAEPAAVAKVFANEGYDLIAAVGTVDTYHTYRGDVALPYQWVISPDERVLARTPGIPVRAVVGDAVRVLAGKFASRTSLPPAPARPEPPAATSPPTGAWVYHTIATTLPDRPARRVVVVEEAPSHRRDLHTHLPITSATGGGYLTAAAGTLGYGAAAAIGVALARPDDLVVCVVGDGSMLYVLQALWTAAQQRTRLIFVVLDNHGYGIMRDVAQAIGATDVPGLDVVGIHWVTVACGLGVHAVGVPTNLPGMLSGALSQAAERAGPTLIHVPVAA